MLFIVKCYILHMANVWLFYESEHGYIFCITKLISIARTQQKRTVAQTNGNEYEYDCYLLLLEIENIFNWLALEWHK